MVKLLVEKYGATIGGFYALKHALSEGRFDIAEYLISKGADINAVEDPRNDDDITILAVMVADNNLAAVKFALDHNADVHHSGVTFETEDDLKNYEWHNCKPTLPKIIELIEEKRKSQEK